MSKQASLMESIKSRDMHFRHLCRSFSRNRAIPMNTGLKVSYNLLCYTKKPRHKKFMANTTLKRANETIGIIPKDGKKLSVACRKLYAAILLFSQQQGMKAEYTAKIQDLLEVAGLTSTRNNPELKKHFVALRSFTVEWNTRTVDDVLIWGASGLIEEPKIINSKNSSTVVTWKLAKEIQEKLVDPQGFYTKFNLEMMTKLRLGGSLALYEICSRYAGNSENRDIGLTAREPVEKWIPKIVGSTRTSYEYRFFKRSILNPAIKEVNENTDINVFLKESKTGKKITDLQFLIKKKDATEFSRLSDVLQKRLGSAGITKKTAALVADNYSQEQISTQLDILEGNTKKGKKIENPNAFLQTGLKEGWEAPKALAKPKKHVDTPKYEITSITDNTVDASAIQQNVLVLLDEMEPSAREVLLKEFYEQENGFVQNLYRNQYFDSLVVATAFCNWHKDRSQASPPTKHQGAL